MTIYSQQLIYIISLFPALFVSEEVNFVLFSRDVSFLFLHLVGCFLAAFIYLFLSLFFTSFTMVCLRGESFVIVFILFQYPLDILLLRHES